jgi:uncharacterized protein (DUF305 family)
MIPHHQQALEMAELARTRAESPDVLALAERIAAAQGPEILVMADWLVDHGREVPDRAHHEPGALHGMLSDDQMAELAQADGAAFDELFLTGMVQHHEGAVETARTSGSASSPTTSTPPRPPRSPAWKPCSPAGEGTSRSLTP